MNDELDGLDGACPAMTRLKENIYLVARDARVTTLILGESGTGKERVARAIHRCSPRQPAPFVVVNCAGLTATLVEDELFGHVRGAFTGALSERAGLIEQADGGIVFLDEIGELPLELQPKLLRTIQERRIRRLGSERDMAVNVQLVAATHVDLRQAVARGRFREDLYYRLSVFELEVPPLRRRGAADIERLTHALLARLAADRRQPPPHVAAEVAARFAAHRWPGNVRELEHTLERMLVAAGGAAILTLAHLPAQFERDAAAHRGAAAALTRAQIDEALARSGHHRGRAAASLGVSRHQLHRRLGPASATVSRGA